MHLFVCVGYFISTTDAAKYKAQLLFTSCSCASASELLNYFLETSAHHLLFSASA